ncbi:MAG: sigma-70 family RNA polymerase sigma factor [Planctomycetes bacterium]|nr:sigma-70 family RNA polymerase sigma factor [Planctomycetota bacterium]
MKSTQFQLSRTEFERLVREHHAAVYASALRIVRDAGLALDVTQDVYLALLSGRIVLRGEGDERVLRWFAIRAALQSMRAGSHRRAREEGYAMQQREAHANASAETGDTADLLARFVERLPDELRNAVHLRFHEGLTFAKMGEALEISEPSAFDRVKRALERLRESLSRAGLGALALDVEGALQAAAPSAPLAPPLVAQKLALLHTGTKAASITTALLSTMLLVVALVVVLPSLFGNGREVGVVYMDGSGNFRAGVETPLGISELPPSTGRASAVLPREPAAGAATRVAVTVEDSAKIVGRIVDPDHKPSAGLVVLASSTEFQGKFPRYGARARTRADGSFEIEVPVAASGVTSYVLALEGRVEFEREPRAELLTVTNGVTAQAGTLRLKPAPRDEVGFFEHKLKIVDTSGRPIPRVHVTLMRAVRSPEGWSDETWEVGVTTTESGIALLEAGHVGDKVMIVDGRAQGYRRLRLARRIEAGFSEETLQLEYGLEIRGRIVDVDGRAIHPRPAASLQALELQLHALSPAEPNEWIFARIEDDGSFVIGGLDDLAHSLDVAGGPWSRTCMEGVRAGTHDQLITLKREDDPRDLGDHCAEIHARIVDAETQQPVKVDVLAADVDELDAGLTPFEFATDVAPSMLVKRPVQVAWFGDYPEPSDRKQATGLKAGTYAYILRAPGYAPELCGPIELAAREMRSDVVFALVRPTTLSGRVLDSDGRPLANAYVFVGGLGPRSSARLAEIDEELVRTHGKPSRNDIVRTDAEGKFAITGLSPRFDYTVYAVHESLEPITGARIAGREPGSVELRFERRR